MLTYLAPKPQSDIWKCWYCGTVNDHPSKCEAGCEARKKTVEEMSRLSFAEQYRRIEAYYGTHEDPRWNRAREPFVFKLEL